MFGSTEIYNALNVSAITGGLDSYRTTYKALFDSITIPSDFTGHKSINFYMNKTYNAATEYETYEYVLNCRAATYAESRQIAFNVIEKINRTTYLDYFIVCFLMQTIIPQDDTDNFNTPITITLKMR
jgi:hypothetical protein